MKCWMGLLVGIVALPGCAAEYDDRPPEGSLRILLHDRPVDSVDEVWIELDEVTVRTIGGDWHVVSTEVRTVDLLTLRGGVVEEIGLAALPAGPYDQIRLHVARGWVVADGVTHDLTVPSGDPSGIKVRTEFSVPECGEATLSLDWDVGAHLVQNDGRGYVLRPVLVVDDLTEDDPEACCAVACDDGNPCTVDSCDASGACVYTTEGADGLACDDTNACTSGDRCRAGACEGGPFEADGAACVAIVQHLDDEANVVVWDYYGTVDAWWWRYQPYEPFDPALGTFRGATIEQTLNLTFDLSSGFLGDTYSERMILSGSHWTADTFPITASEMSRHYEWSFSAEEKTWTSAGWGYYFESRADETPHHVTNRTTLTYFYEPTP